MIVLLFGGPGTGKSTYARHISEKLDLAWVSTGDVFREIAQSDARIKAILDSGQLIPDEEVNQVVFDGLSKTSGNFVLDGFPRTVGQAQTFQDFLSSHNWVIGKIFKLTVPVELVIERLKSRGRSDDDPETIRSRFNIFEGETAPVLEYFKSQGTTVTEIDNTLPIEEVKAEFDKYL